MPPVLSWQICQTVTGKGRCAAAGGENNQLIVPPSKIKSQGQAAEEKERAKLPSPEVLPIIPISPNVTTLFLKKSFLNAKNRAGCA